jgi:hypothetical protein
LERGTQTESLPWPADELVSELSIAARAIGIDEATLATALGNGQTMAQVARVNGVTQRQVVRALVSSVVASAADDIQCGDLSGDQVTWLVALATRRAEMQVTSAYPPIAFRPRAGRQQPPRRRRHLMAVADSEQRQAAGPSCAPASSA